MGPFEPCASVSPKSMRPPQRMDVLGPQTWAISGAVSSLKGRRGRGTREAICQAVWTRGEAS